MQFLAMCDIEKGFIDREHFDIRGNLLQGLHNVAGNPGITLRPGRALNEIRAEF